jgi:hypothetical protein
MLALLPRETHLDSHRCIKICSRDLILNQNPTTIFPSKVHLNLETDFTNAKHFCSENINILISGNVLVIHAIYFNQQSYLRQLFKKLGMTGMQILHTNK